VIRERHSEYEIVGDPMVIKEPSHGTFSQFRRAPVGKDGGKE